MEMDEVHNHLNNNKDRVSDTLQKSSHTKEDGEPITKEVKCVMCGAFNYRVSKKMCDNYNENAQ